MLHLKRCERSMTNSFSVSCFMLCTIIFQQHSEGPWLIFYHLLESHKTSFLRIYLPLGLAIRLNEGNRNMWHIIEIILWVQHCQNYKKESQILFLFQIKKFMLKIWRRNLNYKMRTLLKIYFVCNRFKDVKKDLFYSWKYENIIMSNSSSE